MDDHGDNDDGQWYWVMIVLGEDNAKKELFWEFFLTNKSLGGQGGGARSEAKSHNLFANCTFSLLRLLNTGLQAKVLITREYISNNLERKLPDENKNAR